LVFLFLLHDSSPSKWIFELWLLTPSSENYPAVERGGPAFAAITGSDPKGVGHMLDGVAQANILVANEPWKARPVRLAFALGLFLRHGLHVLII
jgi:hypothetical protein